MGVETGVFVGVIVAVKAGNGVAVGVGWNTCTLEQLDKNNDKTRIWNKHFMKI